MDVVSTFSAYRVDFVSFICMCGIHLAASAVIFFSKLNQMLVGYFDPINIVITKKIYIILGLT